MKDTNVIELTPGTYLNLFAFGRAVVRKVYVQPETKEMVAAVKTETGACLHLSLAYCRKVAL
jgi:hypothetical protein